MSLIGWIIFGWIAGSIGNWLLPIRPDGRATGIETIGCGVAGSVVGGLLEAAVGGGGYRPAGILWSVAGAAAAIWVWRAFTEEAPK
jgi:uncharacterized membrane protein YeaQ/YmgE (transglycosylase-associated protein family)